MFEGRDLFVVSAEGTAPTDELIVRLADAIGLRATRVSIDEITSLGHSIRFDSGTHLIVGAAALASISRRDRNFPGVFGKYSESAASLLIYGFGSGHDSLLAELTGGRVRLHDREASGLIKFSLSNALPSACCTLRGLSTEVVYPKYPRGLAGGDGVVSLITAGGAAVLTKVEQANRNLFLLAGSLPPDLDQEISQGNAWRAQVELLPWMLFFRTVFGTRCWHSSIHRAAVVIDDPLLTPRYGYLHFAELRDAMERHGFASSIAFIPWNHERCRSRMVAMIRRRPDHFSLCVHGNDHTAGEFAAGNLTDFRAKAAVALTRMDELSSATGLAYDRVMVFPQSAFSRDALPAISRQGFLAAIGSNLFAADHETGDLTLRDLLEAAITAYGGAPLFGRRSPNELFQLAFDLFLGKPAFIVQHHQDFRNGVEPLAQACDALRQQVPDLKWQSVGKIIRETCLQKRDGQNRYSVRFYSDTFRFTAAASGNYQFEQKRRNPQPTRFVLCDGTAIDAATSDDRIVTELRLDEGQTVNLEVPTEEARLAPEPRPRGYRARVFVRRMLSEFRDNYLARNEHLLAAANQIVKRHRYTPQEHP